ncbi:female-specific lacrimal gland protein-like [Dipodomys merriami]|uniref:female-specific lacrimal gland protein-like n=1 Tax=Dipodomys merriami TaxID=94247 RepID=UPI00384E2283
MGVPQRKGLLLLLSVWLGLARAGQDQSQVPVQPGFSPEQAEGHWYTIKLGATNPSAVQEGGAFRCFMTNIRGLENGNLNITYFHRKDGKCVKEFYIAEQTNTPGRYTFEYGGRIYLTFVVLNHDIAIMDLESHSDAGPFIVVELHGRSLSPGRQGLDAYRQHMDRRGLGQSHTVDLVLAPRCDSPE